LALAGYIRDGYSANVTRLDPAAHLPLTPIVLHILLALAEGERHGYAIAQEIETATSGRVRAGPGTMYGSIQRMLTASLIEEVTVRSADDERRRFYRATTLGRAVLDLELQRLVDVVAIARGKSLLPDTRIA
jgi:DNA-binding PadR family transcriptional regulator